MTFPNIYLASGSPRRRELLQQIGVEFDVIKLDVDESQLEGEAPLAYAERVAKAKAQAGWQAIIEQQKLQRPVIGADTAVIVEQTILGKPSDPEQAKTMLAMLSGRTHQVITSVALAQHNDIKIKTSVNEVTFAELDQQRIDWYVDTGEGVDKAGSYAVQGLAALFIERISGSYSGIMGLPLRETGQLLCEIASTSHR